MALVSPADSTNQIPDKLAWVEGSLEVEGTVGNAFSSSAAVLLARAPFVPGGDSVGDGVAGAVMVFARERASTVVVSDEVGERISSELDDGRLRDDCARQLMHH